MVCRGCADGAMCVWNGDFGNTGRELSRKSLVFKKCHDQMWQPRVEDPLLPATSSFHKRGPQVETIPMRHFFVDQLITILTMREKPHDFDCIDRRCTRTTATSNQNQCREKAEPSRAPKRRLDVSTPSRRDVIQIEKQRFVARIPHRKVGNISNEHFNGKKLGQEFLEEQ